ncbi:unnamed protein product, partial [Phaeothamnion confervicola]
PPGACTARKPPPTLLLPPLQLALPRALPGTAGQAASPGAPAASGAVTAALSKPAVAGGGNYAAKTSVPTTVSTVQSPLDDEEWIQVSSDRAGSPSPEGPFIRRRMGSGGAAAAGGGGGRTAGGRDGNAKAGSGGGNGGNLALRTPPLAVAHQESYYFTQSGTINLDGFAAPIRECGIAGAAGAACIPMHERLVVLQKLGQGATGIVFKAFDLLELRLVAIKVIPVHDKGKRRQTVHELSALYDSLRQQRRPKKFHAMRSRRRGVEGAATTSPGNGPNSGIGGGGDNEAAALAAAAEAEAAAGRRAIVEFHDAFASMEDATVSIMVEYMDGGSLQDLADAGGCQAEDTLAQIAHQGLLGLRFLHSCSQIHRDLKPANMLINHKGDVKLSDFGIARKLGDSGGGNGGCVGGGHCGSGGRSGCGSGGHSGSNSTKGSPSRSPGTAAGVSNEPRMTSPPMLGRSARSPSAPDGNGGGGRNALSLLHTAQTFVGTVTYMSPERINGEAYSYPSDVWSMGLSLMTTALGRLPLDTKGGYWSVLHAIRDSEPPELPADGSWSEEFRSFTHACLQKDPAKRPGCEALLRHPFVRRGAAA